MRKVLSFKLPYISINNKDIIDYSINRTSECNVVIPHVCNNINLFGSGFAGYLSARLPHVKENFHLLGNKSKLGYVQFVDVFFDKNTTNKVVIANMISQNGVLGEKNTRPLNYFALCHCMGLVKSYIKNLSSTDASVSTEIHAPKFGSGLAGGNWQFITDLIHDIWSDIKVFVHQKN